jgi:hypothetical protein
MSGLQVLPALIRQWVVLLALVALPKVYMIVLQWRARHLSKRLPSRGGLLCQTVRLAGASEGNASDTPLRYY